MKKLLLLALLALPLAADDLADSRTLQQEARQAYVAKDYKTFLTKIRAASDLRPQHAGLLYQLGKAQVLNGQYPEAATTFGRVAGMGMAFAPDEDPELRSMRGFAGFGRILARFEENRAPFGEASTAFTIPTTGLIPEGLALDPKTGTFYVASVRDGIIRSVNRDGVVREFARVPYGAFGMVVDPKRKSLWVATSVVPQNSAFREDARDRAAVVRIDLKSGKIRETISAPSGGKHLFGDVALAPNGDLFVSDTNAPAVYRVRKGKLQPVIEGEPFASLQGIAVAPDGKTVYVADYSKGLYAIDLKTSVATPLTVRSNVSLLGVDGLYAVGQGRLIGTQNGTNPHRVIHIAVDGTNVTSVVPVVANHAEFDEPTLGVPSGELFYFVANSQWNLFDEKGNVSDESKLKLVVVLKTKM
jgi:hypothetical protein